MLCMFASNRVFFLNRRTSLRQSMKTAPATHTRTSSTAAIIMPSSSKLNEEVLLSSSLGVGLGEVVDIEADDVAADVYCMGSRLVRLGF